MLPRSVWMSSTGGKPGLQADDAVIVPQGARHNVVNAGGEPLKLYTIYGPPEHVDGTIHKTKTDADSAHEHFDGRTTE